MTPPAAPAWVVPDGSVSGGHAVAHSPVQVVLPVPSGVYRYSVCPDWSTRIIPSVGLLAVFTVTVADVARVGEPALVVAVVAALEPQAEAIRSSAPSEPPTSHRDRRDEPTSDWRTLEWYLAASVDGIRRTSFPLPVVWPVLRPVR